MTPTAAGSAPGGYDTTYEVVDTPVAMRTALECQGWDVITSDVMMPQFGGSAALSLAKELRPGLPFIIVSGEADLNLAVSLMRARKTTSRKANCPAWFQRSDANCAKRN